MKRGGNFKYAVVGVSVLVALAVLIATRAFPANKSSLQVMSPVTIGGTRLAAGVYTAQWEGSGPGVQLKIKKDNKLVAATPATVVRLDHPFDNDAVLDTRDGDRSLVQVRFSGKKFALQAEGESGSRFQTTPYPFEEQANERCY